MQRRRQIPKTILFSGTILAVAALAFFLTIDVASAASVTDIITKGSGFAKRAAIKGFDVTILILFFTFGLWLLQSILTSLLSFSVFMLNNIVQFNMGWIPSNIPVIVEAWGVIRDIVNAILILIIIWIALTIVLNIEHLGGRRLIFRVIIVALLVNFSLAIVSVVFGFANYLTIPFKNAIGTDIGGIIVNNSRLHTVTNIITEKGFNEMMSQLEEARKAEEAKTQAQPTVSNISLLPIAGLALPAAPKEAQAGFVDNLKNGCLLGGLIGAPVGGVGAGIGCVSMGLAGAVLGALASWAVTAVTFSLAWKMALNLAIADIFLILAIFTIATAAIVLLYRIVAITFLSVLAPGALLLFATPGGQKYFDKWLDNLIKWAFYAPAFFFMFWLSLLILEGMAKTIPSAGTQFSADLLSMLMFIIFIPFLFASIMVARYMGIAVADRFVNWGKGLAWGAAGFAGGLAAGRLRMARDATLRGAMGKEEGWVNKSLRWAQKMPGLRPLAGVTAEARAKKIKDLQEGVEKRANELKALYKGKHKDLLAVYRGAQTAQEKAAAARALGKYSAQLRPDEASDALRFTEKFGMQKDLLKVLPYLAEDKHVGGGGLSKNAAVRKYTAEELDYSDIKNIDTSSVLTKAGDTTNMIESKQAVRIGLWSNKNFSPAALAKLADEDRASAQALLNDVDPLYNELLGYAPPALTAGLSTAERTELLNTLTHVHEPAFKKYFSGTMGRSLGLTEPTAW